MLELLHLSHKAGEVSRCIRFYSLSAKVVLLWKQFRIISCLSMLIYSFILLCIYESCGDNSVIKIKLENISYIRSCTHTYRSFKQQPPNVTKGVISSFDKKVPKMPKCPKRSFTNQGDEYIKTHQQKASHLLLLFVQLPCLQIGVPIYY